MSRLTPCITSMRLRVPITASPGARRSRARAPQSAPRRRSRPRPARAAARGCGGRRGASCRDRRARAASVVDGPSKLERQPVALEQVAAPRSRMAGSSPARRSDSRSATQQAQRHRLAVAECLVAGRGLERVCERVAEVERGPHPVSRSSAADHGQLACGRSPRRPAAPPRSSSSARPSVPQPAHASHRRASGDQRRLHDLREAGTQLLVRKRRAAVAGRRSRRPAGGTRRRSSCASGRSTPVLPP